MVHTGTRLAAGMSMRTTINGFTVWSNMRLATVSSSASGPAPSGGGGVEEERQGEGRRWVVDDILKSLMEGSTMRLLLQSEIYTRLG